MLLALEAASSAADDSLSPTSGVLRLGVEMLLPDSWSARKSEERSEVSCRNGRQSAKLC
jgi:hypothetical protein